MSKAFIQRPAPQFKATAFMPNGEFKDIALSDFKGKYVVLFFWPLDFTFVCPTQIIAYGNLSKKFQELGAVLLGCSVDSKFTHFEYCQKPRKSGGLGKMECPLISDINKTIASDYGCLITEGGDAGVALRATYIIDGKGILRHMTIGDLPVGRNPDETVRLVEAFKFTDEHGQVCPASWKKGDKTMQAKLGSKKNEDVFNSH